MRVGFIFVYFCSSCSTEVFFMLSKRNKVERPNFVATTAEKFCQELATLSTPVTEFKDPVFAKTSPKRSSSVIENERFGLVFAKIGSINSDTVLFYLNGCLTMLNFFFVWPDLNCCRRVGAAVHWLVLWTGHCYSSLQSREIQTFPITNFISFRSGFGVAFPVYLCSCPWSPLRKKPVSTHQIEYQFFLNLDSG